MSWFLNNSHILILQPTVFTQQGTWIKYFCLTWAQRPLQKSREPLIQIQDLTSIWLYVLGFLSAPTSPAPSFLFPSTYWECKYLFQQDLTIPGFTNNCALRPYETDMKYSFTHVNKYLIAFFSSQHPGNLHRCFRSSLSMMCLGKLGLVEHQKLPRAFPNFPPVSGWQRKNAQTFKYVLNIKFVICNRTQKLA